MKYAALIKSQIYVPGDERSRTNPGHGYSGGYETTIKLHEFKDKDDMLIWLRKHINDRSYSFQLIEYRELTVRTTVDVAVTCDTGDCGSCLQCKPREE